MTEPTLAEFIRPHLRGIRRVVDLGSGQRDFGADLQLPPGIRFERLGPAAVEPGSLAADDLLLAVIEAGDGSDATSDADVAAALLPLQATGPGGGFFLIFDGPVSAASDEALIEALSVGHSQVLRIGPVTDAEARSAAFGRRTEVVTVDGAAAVAADPLADGLRLANRAVIAPPASPITAGNSGPTGSQDPVEPATEREIRRLKRQVRASDERIAALEGSASYKIGKAAIGAVRQPRKIARLVPRAKLMWSRRANPVPVRRPAPGRTPAQAAAAWQEALGSDPERLFLAYSSGATGARTQLVIGAIVRDETATALGLDATVHRLSPNDALMTLERADPDLVLIETGAFGAGLPWAYVGSAGAVDRDRILAAVLDTARRLGRPSVLWQSSAVPDPVGIQPFKRRFDLVLGDLGSAADRRGWQPGVQLARFNPHDLDPARSLTPLLVGAWDPRAALTDRTRFENLLLAGADAGLEIRVDSRSIGGAEAFPAALRSRLAGSIDVLATAALYRSRPVVIADSLGQGDGRRRALEALACGTRIVSLPDPLLAAAGGEAFHSVDGIDDAGRALSEAISEGALDTAQIRPISRRIFQAHAVPVALATLTSRLGLGLDPLAQRSIAILIEGSQIDGAEARAALVESIRAQSFRPREAAVLAEADAVGDTELVPAGFIDALAKLGVTTTIVSGPARDDAWQRLAAATSATWVMAWPAGPADPDALLDLALAAESSCAEAVGFVDGSGSGFVSDLPLVGSLLRRELIAEGERPTPDEGADGHLLSLARRGARLFGTNAVATRADR